MITILRILCLILIGSLFNSEVRSQSRDTGEVLPAWQQGYLDIHHINTGRGNAAFCIFPDGTTMLIDAGELSPLDERTFTSRNATIKPNNSKKPFEWIAEYLKKVIPDGKNQIDYALVTHFHDDHFGAWYPDAPLSKSGKFVKTGITGIGDLYEIKTIFDRGFPEYNYPFSFRDSSDKFGGGELEYQKTMNNYMLFLKEKQRTGTVVAALRAGSKSQIGLRKNPALYPSFSVRNLKSAQFIWTGKDSGVINQFPDYRLQSRHTWPDENSLSLAISIQYGRFLYYTGGDNPGMTFPGDNPRRNTEDAIARAVGKVDIATMDHHGNRDAINESMIRTLQPRVWIGQSWSADHPGHEVLLRLTNKHIHEGPVDLFCTNMLEANRIVIGPLVDRAYSAQQGHIVVRVLPGGESYRIFVLDDSNADMIVKGIFGPYNTKSKN